MSRFHVCFLPSNCELEIVNNRTIRMRWNCTSALTAPMVRPSVRSAKGISEIKTGYLTPCPPADDISINRQNTSATQYARDAFNMFSHADIPTGNIRRNRQLAAPIDVGLTMTRVPLIVASMFVSVQFVMPAFRLLENTDIFQSGTDFCCCTLERKARTAIKPSINVLLDMH